MLTTPDHTLPLGSEPETNREYRYFKLIMNIVFEDREYHYFKLIMNIVMVELSRRAQHSLSLSHEHKVSLEKVEGLGLG